MPGREWSDEAIARLRQLWAEGLSTPIIAARLHTTKSAVCGKVHRLDLESRPNPARPGGGPKNTLPSPPRSPRPTLPPSLTVVPPPQPPRAEQPTPPPSPPPPRPAPVSSSAACCWPLGDPRTKSFRFCGDTAAPDRPYCPTHVARAYIPLPATRSA